METYRVGLIASVAYFATSLTVAHAQQAGSAHNMALVDEHVEVSQLGR
jgi:hypothetical protein